MEGCTGACKAEDARDRQHSPSAGPCAPPQPQQRSEIPPSGGTPGTGRRHRPPSAPPQPPSPQSSWRVPSPDPEGSPGNTSCADCYIQLLRKTREHPVLRGFPPGILEETIARRKDLELLRKLLGGIAHYFLHKTHGCQAMNKVVCYPGKKAVLD